MPSGSMVATRQRVRRVSGALLVAGFALMIPGVAFAVASQTGTDAVPPTFATHAGGVLLIGTVSLTLLGLIGFAWLLWFSGDRMLSSAGTAAYAVAATAWVIATGRAFALHVWTYELEVVFIVASALAMTAFGASVLRTGVVSRRTGWLAIGWGIGALIVFALPYEGFPPLVTQFVPLMVGVALLRRDARERSAIRGPGTAAGVPPSPPDA
jgi:hypothetical protein